MPDFVVYLVIFGVPLLALVWFIVSLILFLRTDKGDVGKRKKRRVLMIVSAITAGVLAGALLTLMVMMMLVLAYM